MGGAAQIVKVVSEGRGWPHISHRHLFTAVDTLRYETGDADVRRLFDVASAPPCQFLRGLEKR